MYWYNLSRRERRSKSCGILCAKKLASHSHVMLGNSIAGCRGQIMELEGRDERKQSIRV